MPGESHTSGGMTATGAGAGAGAGAGTCAAINFATSSSCTLIPSRSTKDLSSPALLASNA
jgi:hypothetical protein